jgi:hypothetical protein
MKSRLWHLFLALALSAVPALADQITFSIVAPPGNVADLAASKSGLRAGPGQNITVSDTTLGMHVPLAGVFTASTGAASAFAVASAFVLATYKAGGTDSVLITDPATGAVLVSGTMEGDSGMLAQYPGGAGSFLGSFTVTSVNPAVLGMFGLSGFNPNGSVSFTFGQDQLSGRTLDAVVGGGSVTIVASPVRESSTLALVLIGVVLVAVRRYATTR